MRSFSGWHKGLGRNNKTSTHASGVIPLTDPNSPKSTSETSLQIYQPYTQIKEQGISNNVEQFRLNHKAQSLQEETHLTRPIIFLKCLLIKKDRLLFPITMVFLIPQEVLMQKRATYLFAIDKHQGKSDCKYHSNTATENYNTEKHTAH